MCSRLSPAASRSTLCGVDAHTEELKQARGYRGDEPNEALVERIALFLDEKLEFDVALKLDAVLCRCRAGARQGAP